MAVDQGALASKYRSVRNGFVVASVLLAAATVVDLTRTGSDGTMVFAALIFSQLAFWGSRLYYGRLE